MGKSKIRNVLSFIFNKLDVFAILFVDAILIVCLFSTFSEDGSLHPFFILFIIPFWFFFNLSCIFYIESTLQNKREKDIDNIDTNNISRLRKNIHLVFSKLKYIAIGFVDFVIIVLIGDAYLKENTVSQPFPFKVFFVLLLYNLLCFGFIWRTKKMENREFYRFLIITAPVLIAICFFTMAVLK